MTMPALVYSFYRPGRKRSASEASTDVTPKKRTRVELIKLAPEKPPGNPLALYTRENKVIVSE